MRSRLPAVVAASLLVLVSCSAIAGDSKRAAAEDLRIEKAGGGFAALSAEIAADDASRERGLMFRESLADGKGMLFVFESDRRLAFWMKNTLVPLSIAYISSDGRITEILDMSPGSLAAVESRRSVRYALEVPRGWFSRVGVAEGDRLEIPERVRRAAQSSAR